MHSILTSCRVRCPQTVQMPPSGNPSMTTAFVLGFASTPLVNGRHGKIYGSSNIRNTLWTGEATCRALEERGIGFEVTLSQQHSELWPFRRMPIYRTRCGAKSLPRHKENRLNDSCKQTDGQKKCCRFNTPRRTAHCRLMPIVAYPPPLAGFIGLS